MIRLMRIVLPSLVLSAFALAATPAKAQVQHGKYCLEGNAPVSLLLIDVSEAYDRVDQRRFASGMNTYFQNLRPGWQVDVMPINNRPGEVTALYRACVPGCPDELEQGESNWSNKCDRIVIERDKQRFQTDFVRVMRAIVNAGVSAGGTQIVRGLEAVGYQYPTGRVGEMTIFSDMLEYSDLNWRINSFDDKDAQALIAKGTKILSSVQSFKGTDVIAFGFGKRLGQQTLIDEKGEAAALLKPSQAQRFRTVWQSLFSTLGVRSFRMTQNR